MPAPSHPWDSLADQAQAELRHDAEAIAPRLFGGVPADMVRLPEADLLRRFRADWPNPEQRQWWLRAFGPVQFLAMWKRAWKDATPEELAAATAPPPPAPVPSAPLPGGEGAPLSPPTAPLPPQASFAPTLAPAPAAASPVAPAPATPLALPV